ncbi:uncharacterized protein METZ01_LOCUS451730, partial [marine metagenome]
MVNTFTGDLAPVLEQSLVRSHDLDTPGAHGELPSFSGISIQRGIYHHQAPKARRPCPRSSIEISRGIHTRQMFHRFCLLAGVLTSTSLSAQLPAPSAKTFPVPATKVEVLATGKGFVRLQFRANLGMLDETDQTTDRAGESTQSVVTLARQWVHTSLVGLPPGAQPR